MEENAAKRDNDSATAKSQVSAAIKSGGHESQRKSRFYYEIVKVSEGALVVLLIFVTWGLFSLPIIFNNLDFSMPAQEVDQTIVLDEGDKDISGDQKCSNVQQLDQNDQNCYLELVNVLLESGCSLASDQSVSVLRNGRVFVEQIFFGLDFINARESCLLEATSFLCLYSFGLCSSSGVTIQPTFSQCEVLRDSVCQTEWATAISFGISLPNCNDLPAISGRCPIVHDVNTSSLISMPSEQQTESQDPLSSPMLLECTDGFYRENGSKICIPSCKTWHQYGRKLSILFDVLVLVAAIFGTSAGVAILSISYFRQNNMCSFPAILVVYMVVDSLSLDFFLFVSYTNRSGLFCSSQSLLESVKRVTPFCVITGIVVQYVLLQLVVWYLFHTSILFWRVVFPFHAQKFMASRKLKYVHTICLLVGFLFPLETVISAMTHFGVQSQNRAKNGTSAVDLFLSGGLGYNNFRYPPILCSFSNTNVAFYSSVLLVDFILAIGTTMLIVIIWQIHKKTSRKDGSLSNVLKFGTAEKKLFIVYIYMGLFIFIVLINFTIDTVSNISRGVFDYFVCEQRGRDPENPCRQSNVIQRRLYSLSLISYIAIALFPVVVLVFAINITDLKKLITKISSKHASSK